MKAFRGLMFAVPASLLMWSCSIFEVYQWTHETEAAQVIVFRVQTHKQMAVRCGKPVVGCATVGGPVSTIDFAQPWDQVPDDLLLHELKHAKGWNHQ